MFRDLSRNEILAAVPGILIIDIGRDIIAFHLDMGRNPDIRPCTAVIRDRLKAGRRVRGLLGIRNLPQTVQGIAEYRISCCSRRLLRPPLQLLFVRKKDVVRMCRKTVFLKNGRIRRDPRIKLLLLSHQCFLLLLFCFSGCCFAVSGNK